MPYNRATANSPTSWTHGFFYKYTPAGLQAAINSALPTTRAAIASNPSPASFSPPVKPQSSPDRPSLLAKQDQIDTRRKPNHSYLQNTLGASCEQEDVDPSCSSDGVGSTNDKSRNTKGDSAESLQRASLLNTSSGLQTVSAYAEQQHDGHTRAQSPGSLDSGHRAANVDERGQNQEDHTFLLDDQITADCLPVMDDPASDKSASPHGKSGDGLRGSSRSSSTSLKRKRSQSASPGQKAPSQRLRSTSPLSVLSQTPDLSQTPQIDPSEPPSTLDGTTQARAIFIRDSQDDEDLSSDSELDAETQVSTAESLEKRPRMDIYDSDSSLEDLDVLLKRKKPGENTRAVSPLTAFRSQAKSAASAAYNNKRRALGADSNASFQRLVSQAKREQDARVKIEETRRQLEVADSKKEPEEEEEALGGLSEGTLAALVEHEDDEGKVGRLKQAIERTDLLAKGTEWYFFNYDSAEGHQEVPPWPASLVSSSTWVGQLQDTRAREHAFISGFAAERLLADGAWDELQAWLRDAAMCEPDELLAQSYMEALETCYQNQTEKRAHDMLRRMLERTGARHAAVQDEAKIRPLSENPKMESPRPPKRVSRLLRLMQRLSHGMTKESLIFATKVVLRMCIDRVLTDDLDVSLHLSNTVTSLVTAFRKEDADPSLHTIALTFLRTLTSPILQARLLVNLPRHTPRLHNSVRRLALAFFLSSKPSYLTSPSLSSTAFLTSTIINHLTTTPALSPTNPDVDYRVLTASMHLLNIAIDGGFGFPSFITSDHAPSHNHNNNPNPDSQSTSIPTSSHLNLRQRTQTYNTHVDALHATLTRLNSRINDVGASHMLRTEAKSAVSMLLLRLDYGVRTKPKPKRNVFAETLEGGTGGGFTKGMGKKGRNGEGKGHWGGFEVDDGKERDREVMRKFLEGKKRREERQGLEKRLEKGPEKELKKELQMQAVMVDGDEE